MSKRDAIGLESIDRVQTASEVADSSGLSDNELSKVLNAVSAMMSASGQRQSTAMQDMRQRISELSDEARDVSQTLPDEHRSSFQRIADAMTELADRVSEEREGHQQLQQPAMTTTTNGDTPDVDQTDVSRQSPAEPPPTSAGAENVAPIHSSAVDVPQMTARSEEATEYFADLDDPWDEASAEQLTRLYEDAAFDSRQYVTPDVAVPEPIMPASPRVWKRTEEVGEADSPSERAGITPQDRTWLSKQFSEIATNIELSSAGSDRYDTAINSIEQRLDALEGLVRTAVQDGATRSDVAKSRRHRNGHIRVCRPVRENPGRARAH